MIEKITDLLKALNEHLIAVAFTVGCVFIFLGVFDVGDFKSVTLRADPAWLPIGTGSIFLGASVIPIVLGSVSIGWPVNQTTAGRLKALTGHWNGSFDQTNLNGSIRIEITGKGKSLQGTASLSFDLEGRGRVLNLKLKSGSLLHDRFLKFDYVQDQPGVIQFGALIVELLPDARQLRGKYAGFGSITNSIAGGSVQLAKIDET